MSCTLKLGPVHLNVSDRKRSADFYRTVLGLHENLSADGLEPLLVLHETPGAPAPTGRAGLFHVALLYPDRPSLGGALRRLRDHGWPLSGASDHQVSEALYLDDPDGLGIELYRDRPRSEWGEMTTLPLDVEALASDAHQTSSLPPDTRIGHVHLQVLDLERSREFYVDGLGLDVMYSWRGALFVAADGYHHHLGLNSWNRPRLPASPDVLGLRSYTLELEPAHFARATERLGGPHLQDPSGIAVELRRSAE